MLLVGMAAILALSVTAADASARSPRRPGQRLGAGGLQTRQSLIRSRIRCRWPMQYGEEETREMPPNSTQNLNAKLSLKQTQQERSGGTGIYLTPPPIQSYSPPN